MEGPHIQTIDCTVFQRQNGDLAEIRKREVTLVFNVLILQNTKHVWKSTRELILGKNPTGVTYVEKDSVRAIALKRMYIDM